MHSEQLENTQVDLGKISDHLANERTFLAWIRTSISVIVFGFVVAKFSITLHQLLMLKPHAADDRGISLVIGIIFMIMGVVSAVLATLQYQKVRLAIQANDFKPSGRIVRISGMVTSVFGLVLVGYLIWTAEFLFK